MTLVVVSTDGYVGPTTAGWAFVATTPLSEIREGGPLPPGPSHLVEWRAAAEALAWAESRLGEGDEMELRTDSALVAKGLASPRPAMSGEAAETRAYCRQTLARLAAMGIRVKVTRVRREENADADELARESARPRE